jgi:hypothetical protein
MVPKYRTGDLVILRRSGGYHVGEIVAYRSPLLHSIVLHRIVGESDGLFTFKGDNNAFVDPVRLPASYIDGTDFLDLPHKWAFVTFSPLILEVAVFVFFLGGVVALAGPDRKRWADIASHAPSRPTGHSSVGATPWITGGAAGLCVFGGVMVLSSGATTSRDFSSSVPYTGRVAFSYHATTAPDVTYPTGVVTTGMPVFLNLVDSVAVQVAFKFESTAPVDLKGTIRIGSMVQESDGWSHALTSSPPVAFSGPAADATVVLPLKQAVALAQEAAHETGVQQGAESVVVSPVVSLRGTVGGQGFSETLHPSLTFEMDPLELSLLSASGSGLSPQYPQLVSSTSGALHRSLMVTTAAAVLGFHVDPAAATTVCLVGALGSASCIGAGLVMRRKRRDRGEDERALRRLRDEIVPIANDPSQSFAALVDVATLTALAGLAERFDVGLLHYREGGRDVYFVSIGELLYRCRPALASGRLVDPTVVRSRVAPVRQQVEKQVDSNKGRHARRRSRPLIPKPPDLETYEELLTYGTDVATSARPSLILDFPFGRLRPRKLSRHGSPRHAKGSTRARAS